MAGVTIRIDSRNGDAILRALSRISQAGTDLRVPLEDVGEHLLNTHRKRWDLEQSPDGIPWEPLSEAYGEGKRRERPVAVVLVFDDLLRDTLRYQIRGSAVELGTDLPYRATHQFGRDFGRGAPIPASPKNSPMG